MLFFYKYEFSFISLHALSRERFRAMARRAPPSCAFTRAATFTRARISINKNYNI